MKKMVTEMSTSRERCSRMENRQARRELGPRPAGRDETHPEPLGDTPGGGDGETVSAGTTGERCLKAKPTDSS